jgi:hypothetical protein
LLDTGEFISLIMIVKKFLVMVALILVKLLILDFSVSAHPASGIVVDKYGNVYFIYTGVGVVKISPDGKLSYIYTATDGHWMCLDEKGAFSRAQPKYFKRITPDGVSPAIIFAGGGSPVVVNKDGNFYYCGGENGDLHPGASTIVRETSQNEQSILSSTLEKTLNGFNDGITGLAAGPDGSVYAACSNSLLKVGKDGSIKTIFHTLSVSDCDEDPADHKDINRGKPWLRGIDVDSTGTVYTAATSCHCLLKITPGGEVSTILKVERPWSPTGVAVRNGNIYVLEYTNANGPAKEGWLPRVQKIGRDGRISTIVSFNSMFIPELFQRYFLTSH